MSEMLYSRGGRAAVVVEADADAVAERTVVDCPSPCYVCAWSLTASHTIQWQKALEIDPVPSASEGLL